MVCARCEAGLVWNIASMPCGIHSMTMSLIVRSGARVRSDRDLHPQRAPSRCRLFQCSGVIDTILEDRDLDRYALDLFVVEREQPLLAVGERLYNIAG